ncbi:MAG TPA: phage tail sheath subtilisin-like domain-containing protein [Pyrinomonadaceae bacterium]|nr:phage tail sheath subtilisin-like domain-containing protein [Pyrinomonadaceae bacterium]
MPITPTYPGVYIEELPSGVRTITGVATSITAFIGRALRGPVNVPKFINSFSDFERIFGGLWIDSSLGFAVRDFYMNGGSQAIVVRLFHPFYATDAARADALDAAQDASDAAQAVAGGDPPADVAAAARGVANNAANTAEPRKSAADAVADAAEAAAAATGATNASVKAAAAGAVAGAAPITRATVDANGLGLVAASEGKWGNSLRARVDHDVAGGAADLFNLTIRDDQTGQIEMFRNVSVTLGHTRQVDRVLENESSLVRMNGSLPGAKPAAHADPDLTATPPVPLWGDDPNNPNLPNATNDKITTGISSDGSALVENDFTGPGLENAKQGLYALRKADLFNLLCIPPYKADGNVDTALISTATAYCQKRRAMMIVDPDATWNDKDDAKDNLDTYITTKSSYAALYFPRLRQPNPLREGQLEDFAPCGAIAGVMARTDTTRGVWKAPAGLEANLVGVPQLSVPLTDNENGELNPLAINCLRAMPGAGRVVWGARTLAGDDRTPSDWKYVPVRRTALFIEESLYRGTQWIVFEPNDEPLWAQIRLNIGAFMHNLFRQGAFQGTTPQEAYFVKCDKETTTQNDINLGIVNIIVGFAPLKPAEFVILKIQQIAGKIEA